MVENSRRFREEFIELQGSPGVVLILGQCVVPVYYGFVLCLHFKPVYCVCIVPTCFAYNEMELRSPSILKFNRSNDEPCNCMYLSFIMVGIGTTDADP